MFSFGGARPTIHTPLVFALLRLEGDPTESEDVGGAEKDCLYPRRLSPKAKDHSTLYLNNSRAIVGR